MIDFLENISLIHWLIGIIIVLIPIAIYFMKYIILQIKFARNLRRKIYFIKLNDSKPLTTERTLISNTHLFNVEKEIYSISNDPKILQLMNKHSLFVVGYDNGYERDEDLHKLLTKIY